jgi:hypothetical protein
MQKAVDKFRFLDYLIRDNLAATSFDEGITKTDKERPMSDRNDPQSGPEFSSLEDLMVPPGGDGYGPLKLREDVTTRMMYPSSSDGLHEAKLLPRFLGPGYKQKYDWGKVHDTVDSLYQTLPQVPYTDEYTEKKAKPLASFRDWLDRAPEHVAAGYKGLASLGLGDGAEQGVEARGDMGNVASQGDGGEAQLYTKSKTERANNMHDWMKENFAWYKRMDGYADKARDAAKARFPEDSLHNGIGDAYRHALWNEYMSNDIGSIASFVLSSGYELKNFIEQYDHKQDFRWDEAFMDTYNNYLGSFGPGVEKLLEGNNLWTIKDGAEEKKNEIEQNENSDE